MSLKVPLVFKLQTLIFWISFVLLFVVGGGMAFIGIPFRPFIAALFAIFIFPFHRIKLNKVLFAFTLLFLVILFSGVLNHSSGIQLALFLRNLITCFLVYFIASGYLNKEEVRERLVKWCTILGLTQLPIIIFQKVFYSQLIKISAVAISYWDIGSGTFFIKNDSSMSIFLIGLVIYHLFGAGAFKKNRTVKVVIFVLGIFAAGSRVSQLAILAIIAYFFFRNLRLKTVLSMSLIFLVMLFGLSKTVLFTEFQSQLTLVFAKLDFSNIDARAMMKFQEGQYSRAAAVLYYLSEPLKFLGDGPSAYYDVLNREHLLGNTGHIFTFYSEVGIVGLIMSYWLIYELGRYYCPNNSVQRNLYFFAIVCLSITSSLLSDAGILLAYFCLMFVLSENCQQETT